MITILIKELKDNLKSLLIWAVCVGSMGLACILLFESMKEDMANMAESFSSMGAFSDAFGMSRLSIATLTGFYATEVGTIHALGGAMFAAILGTSMLSKEEDGHTGEFLFSLPITKGKVVLSKWCALVVLILFFNLLCVCMYVGGFLLSGEEIPAKEFLLYHAMQVLMQTELAAVCYAVSSFMKKNKLGLGLGIVLMLYAFDLIAHVIPDLSDSKVISPFSYANASDILGTGELYVQAVILGVVVLVIGICTAFLRYTTRDLAS